MFCKRCLYDLQGQQSPRCPECGTEFAFDDPRTFFEAPTRVARILLRIRRRRQGLLLALTVLLLLCYVAAAWATQASIGFPRDLPFLASSNLKSVMTVWLIQKHDHPEQGEFDVEAAKQHLRPGASAYSESRSERWRLFVSGILADAPWFVVPTIVYLAAVAILFAKRTRRIAIGLIVAMTLLLLASTSPYENARRIFPTGHAYLDDIVIIPLDLDSVSGDSIAAYDAMSFRRPGRRGIGFADGHVEWLTDEKARPLFEAQGLDYPVRGDSGVASE